MGFLPLEVFVIFVGGKRLDVSAVDGITLSKIVAQVVCAHVGEVVVAQILLAGNTIAAANLEFAQHAAGAFHPCFVEYLPAQSKGGEGTPAMVLAEAAGTVATHGGCKHVAVHKGVVQTGEERYQLVRCGIGGLGGVLVVGKLAQLGVFGPCDSGVDIAAGMFHFFEFLPGITCGDINK